MKFAVIEFDYVGLSLLVAGFAKKGNKGI